MTVSQEDGGYEGQDLSQRGHAAPFLTTKLGGRMREAQSEGAVSPQIRQVGVRISSRGPAGRFISLAHV